ncbi:hypothetical protein CSV75_04525 [Sporosarcina sp. P18a]|uniref:hypothetical protein n=1 Tax=Sporosarcina sp. P18a TaxID=2048259 RepID=UPI000C16A0D0|nr:hypothetical protein [Sporosarcina sp. P18a]PIC81050.1 hypothetical protein CSV75_04525 [Sporosarcina sp. P18a]
MISARNEPTILILDDIEIKWTWKESELLHFREMWSDGVPINDLARELKTNKRSVALLVMDQEMKDEIEQRKFGLYGN